MLLVITIYTFSFQGLDFVISEAKKYGIHLILSLVNNWDDFGGKKQYVQWARDHGGQYLNSDDDFFTNVVVKGYYKNHLKVYIYMFGKQCFHYITKIFYNSCMGILSENLNMLQILFCYRPFLRDATQSPGLTTRMIPPSLHGS